MIIIIQGLIIERERALYQVRSLSTKQVDPLMCKNDLDDNGWVGLGDLRTVLNKWDEKTNLNNMMDILYNWGNICS